MVSSHCLSEQPSFCFSESAGFDCGSLLCHCEFVSLKSGANVGSEFVCGFGCISAKN